MLINILIPLLFIFVIAILTLLERRLLANYQRRLGPDRVGLFGILQPIADALKLLFKETIVPGMSNSIIFICSPLLIFLLSLLNWSIIPIVYGHVLVVDLDLGFFFILAISSLGVYGIIMAGWASNSKYAFLGSLRAAAQMISYEVSLGVIVLGVIIYAESFNLTTLVESQVYGWNIFYFWPNFFLFFIAVLAETNRVPFDLPEAESELVSGYNVEYSAFTFALFFLAEYSNIILLSFLVVFVFLGGWLSFNHWSFFLSGEFWLISKLLVVLYVFILIRGSLPRYRYDQLMMIGWKILLPLSLGLFLFNMMGFFFYFWVEWALIFILPIIILIKFYCLFNLWKKRIL